MSGRPSSDSPPGSAPAPKVDKGKGKAIESPPVLDSPVPGSGAASFSSTLRQRGAKAPAATPTSEGHATGLERGGGPTTPVDTAGGALATAAAAFIDKIPDSDLATTAPDPQDINPPSEFTVPKLTITDDEAMAGPSAGIDDPRIAELFEQLKLVNAKLDQQAGAVAEAREKSNASAESVANLSQQLDAMQTTAYAALKDLTANALRDMWKTAIQIGGIVLQAGVLAPGVAIPNFAWKSTEMALGAKNMDYASHFFVGGLVGAIIRPETTFLAGQTAKLLTDTTTYKPDYTGLKELIHMLFRSAMGGLFTAGALAGAEQIHKLVHGDPLSYFLVALGFYIAAMTMELAQVLAGKLLGWAETKTLAAWSDAERRAALWEATKKHYQSWSTVLTGRLPFGLAYGEHTTLVKKILRPMHRPALHFTANAGLLAMFTFIYQGLSKLSFERIEGFIQADLGATPLPGPAVELLEQGGQGEEHPHAE